MSIDDNAVCEVVVVPVPAAVPVVVAAAAAADGFVPAKSSFSGWFSAGEAAVDILNPDILLIFLLSSIDIVGDDGGIFLAVLELLELWILLAALLFGSI